jgi:hypothetical protein
MGASMSAGAVSRFSRATDPATLDALLAWLRAAEIDGGSSFRIAPSRPAWLLPTKAFRPVAISYTTAPNAKMSLRASASCPSIYSGAMYWNVPRIVPWAVMLGGVVSIAVGV